MDARKTYKFESQSSCKNVITKNAINKEELKPRCGLVGTMEDEEERVVVVEVHSVCRFCLRTGGALSDIFDDSIDSLIIDKVATIARIQIQPDENLPMKVCHRCRYLIEMCYEFQSLILQSHKTLKENVDNGSDDPFLQRDDSGSDCSSIDVVNDDPNTEDSPDKYVGKSCSLSNEHAGDSDMIDDCILKKNVSGSKKTVINNNKENKSINLEIDSFEQHDDSETLNDSPSKIVNKFPSLNTANQKNYCALCYEKCVDKASLKEHIDNHYTDTDLKPYYLYNNEDSMCNICNTGFAYRCQLIVHQRDHLKVKPYRCTVAGCESKFVSKTALRHHIPIHGEKNFVCSVCAVRFHRKSDLTSHELTHEDEGVQYTCPICKRVFKNRFTKATHMLKHKKQPKFTCRSCPKKFFSQSERARHEYIHNTDKNFQCDKCHCSYYSLSSLHRHMKLCHKNNNEEKQPSLVCDLCWQEHEKIPYAVKRKINGIRKRKEFTIRCEECYKGFFQEICFKTHLDTCNSELTSQLLEDANELIAMDAEHNFQ